MQLPLVEALEERLAAVGKTDGLQRRLSDNSVGAPLLHHGGQLLVVADEDETVYAVTGKDADKARLENLRRLVDNAERKVLDIEDEGAGKQHRRGGYNDADGVYEQAAGIHLTDAAFRRLHVCLCHTLAYHAAAEPGVAGRRAANAQIVHAGGVEHGAYLVHGAVGVGGEEYGGGRGGRQLVVHEKPQGHGGLASAWRPHKQEVVARLAHAQEYVVVVGVVVARQAQRRVGLRLALTQEQVAPPGVSWRVPAATAMPQYTTGDSDGRCITRRPPGSVKVLWFIVTGIVH